MKKKYAKRLLSLSLSLGMLCGVVGTEGLPVSAESDYDVTLTLTYPRPGAYPKAPSRFVGSDSLKLTYLGTEWRDLDDTAQWNDNTEFIKWMHTLNDDISPINLEAFVDGREYEQYVYLKVSNASIPVGTEAVATLVDSGTSEQPEELDTGEIVLVNMAAYLSMLPEGTSLPSCITEQDSLMMISTDYLSCAPKGHTHTAGSQYQFDEHQHWRVCTDCGVKLASRASNHYASTDKCENWTQIQKATATKGGIWQKKCGTCDYVYETLKSPTTKKQVMVSTYDELKAALAKGGQKWITLQPESSVNAWLIQEDMASDNALVLDDPDANIIIDLNGCGISRETGKYDDALFDVRQGKLRIFSTKLAAVPNDEWNLSFRSTAKEFCLFRVGENGTLRLTNISGTTPKDNLGYGTPIVISKGNLQIDGGYYCNSLKSFSYSGTPRAAAVVLDGGNAVINGGRYEGEGCGVAALWGSQLTVNGGYIGGWEKGLYIGQTASVVINGGSFERTKTVGSTKQYQTCGVWMDSQGTLTINGGSFYGDQLGLFVRTAEKAIIQNGYFWAYNATEQHRGALAFYSTEIENITIYNGTFVGDQGITCYNGMLGFYKFKLSELLPGQTAKYSRIRDDYTGSLDPDAEASVFGASYLEIDYMLPQITKQPEAVEVPMGGEMEFTVEAKNGTYYEWAVCDADDESMQPYDWDIVLSHASNIIGDGNTLTIIAPDSWFDGKAVYAYVSNKYGGVTSDTASVSVILEEPVATSQPKNVIVAPGGTASFTFHALYANDFSWDWKDLSWDQVDGDGLAESSGVYSRKLTLQNITEELDGQAVYCNAQNELGSVQSDYAYITVGVAGDVNEDGEVTVADLLMLQRWLIQSGTVTNGRLGDLDGNGTLNGTDLYRLKRMLLIEV